MPFEQKNQLIPITQEEFDREYLKSSNNPSRLNFHKRDFRGVIFPEFCVLRRVDLSNSNLENVDLKGADLRNASLRGANLRGAILRTANLRTADLREADLREAILRGANLRGANLENVNFVDTILSETRFEDAIVDNIISTDADITDALMPLDIYMNFIKNGAFENDGRDFYNTIQINTSANVKNIVESSQLDIDKFEQLKFAEVQSKLDKLAKEKEIAEKTIKNKLLELELLRNKFRETDKIKNQVQSEKSDLQREYKAQIEKLESFLKEAKKKTEEKDSIIKKLEEEKINTTKDLEKRGAEIEEALTAAFVNLEKVDEDIEPEIIRLEGIYNYFCKAIFAVCGILAYLWYIAFNDLRGIEDLKLTSIWIYSAPSLILVGFIWGSIIQINRAQRQLVNLRKYNRKYKIIKNALEGYYKVENKLSKTPEKAKETFDSIIQCAINENIDTDKEEEKIKQNNSKDQIPIKAGLDQAIDYLQKLKGLSN